MKISGIENIKIKLLISCLIIGMSVGIVVSYNPYYLLGISVLILLFVFLIVKLQRIILVILLLSVFSTTSIINIDFIGLDVNSVYKLLIITLVLVLGALYSFNFNNYYPILGLFFILCMTYTFSNMHPRLHIYDPFISFIGLAAPFSLFLIKWDKKTANQIILFVILLPIISVASGYLLSLFTEHNLFKDEITGALRLQGTSIAAHLAMLSFVSIGACVVELKRNILNKKVIILITCANFLILVSTGTRGPLLALLIMSLFFVYPFIKKLLKLNIVTLLSSITFFTFISFVLSSQLQNLLNRTVSLNSNSSISLSGREEAWIFFLKELDGHQLFGRGLGAVLVANDGSIFRGFTVPHNEYIRFLFDGGIVGLIVFIISLLYVNVNIYKKVSLEIKYQIMVFFVGVWIYAFIDNVFSTVQFIVPYCFLLSALYSIPNNYIRVRSS